MPTSLDWRSVNAPANPSSFGFNGPSGFRWVPGLEGSALVSFQTGQLNLAATVQTIAWSALGFAQVPPEMNNVNFMATSMKPVIIPGVASVRGSLRCVTSPRSMLRLFL